MSKTLKEKLYVLVVWKRLMFDYPKLSLKKVNYDDYWKDKRGTDMGALSDWQTERADFVLANVAPNKKFAFLDIGCGEGNILNYLTGHGIVSKSIGVDVSAVALAQAKKFGVETVEADITNKEFLENIPACDYALLFEILEHIPHSEEMLQSVFRKCRSGLFFSFPNTGFFVHRFRLLFGKFPMQWKLFPGEHLRFWTLKDLRWWLRSLGYKDYTVYCYQGVPFLNKIWPSLFAAGFLVLIKKI